MRESHDTHKQRWGEGGVTEYFHTRMQDSKEMQGTEGRGGVQKSVR